MRAIETIVTNFSGVFPDTLGTNSTGPSTKDGTELIANLFNDYIGVFPQALLNHMGITPNGNAETSADSQQIDALLGMFGRYGQVRGCIGRPDTDTLHDVIISAGVVSDSTRSYIMYLSTPISKQGDVAWAAGGTPGTPAGGLMGGTWSANTEYGVYLIYNPTTKVTDAGFSVYTGAGVPTFLPAGFTVYQMVDWVKTDGSSQIIQYNRYDLGGGLRRFKILTGVDDVTLTNSLSTTPSTHAIGVATGFICFAKINIETYDALTSHGDKFYTPGTSVARTLFSSAGFSNQSELEIITNTSRQLAAVSSISTVDLVKISVIEFDIKMF